MERNQKVNHYQYTYIFVILLCGLCIALTTNADDYWDHFRGPNSQGKLEGANPPTVFDQKTNLKWKTAFPSGHSSPMIWEDKIFITAFTKPKTLETICLNRNNGKILWRKTAPAETIEKYHKTSSPATSSPCVDAEQVYVYFGSYGLLCYDHSGEEQWRKEISTPASRGFGSGTSPKIHKNTLFLTHDSNEGESYLLAVDAETGENVWKTLRPFAQVSWSTPIL